MKIDNQFLNPNFVKTENKEHQNMDNYQSFSETLMNFVADINNDLQEGRNAKIKIVNGEVENLEQLLFQIEKAGISLKLITEIRNKALESYQEIMRMQV
ncbi:MAG: flagellar hook-basal body complex protein FliE [Hydrogenothermus sp.]|nr:MAG: flagellar hook-basal body complex protein FliE [Hydrogenothermus sp.]